MACLFVNLAFILLLNPCLVNVPPMSIMMLRCGLLNSDGLWGRRNSNLRLFYLGRFYVWGCLWDVVRVIEARLIEPARSPLTTATYHLSHPWLRGHLLELWDKICLSLSLHYRLCQAKRPNDRALGLRGICTPQEGRNWSLLGGRSQTHLGVLIISIFNHFISLHHLLWGKPILGSHFGYFVLIFIFCDFIASSFLACPCGRSGGSDLRCLTCPPLIC